MLPSTSMRGTPQSVCVERLQYLASFARYDRALQEILTRIAAPGPLTIDEFEHFVAAFGKRYRVQWRSED